MLGTHMGLQPQMLLSNVNIEIGGCGGAGFTSCGMRDAGLAGRLARWILWLAGGLLVFT